MRLKELRKKKNLSQQKLALDLNISQAAISKYEQGLAEPDIRMLKELSEYFCVSIDYLVERTNENFYFMEKPLDLQEQEMLFFFRRLRPLQKEKALSYVQGMADA